MDYTHTGPPENIELSFAQTLAAIETIDRVADRETERATALLDAVHRRMVHYDGPALRVSPADNWLLWWVVVPVAEL